MTRYGARGPPASSGASHSNRNAEASKNDRIAHNEQEGRRNERHERENEPHRRENESHERENRLLGVKMNCRYIFRHSQHTRTHIRELQINKLSWLHTRPFGPPYRRDFVRESRCGAPAKPKCANRVSGSSYVGSEVAFDNDMIILDQTLCDEVTRKLRRCRDSMVQ